MGHSEKLRFTISIMTLAEVYRISCGQGIGGREIHFLVGQQNCI
jgi:hypothetical protein